MAFRTRDYFFDPGFTDRFNNKDLPSEDTFRDWSDGVPFYLEPDSSPLIDKAGILKQASDKKINDRENTDDQSGVSPLGFALAVQPAQIPKVYAGDSSINVELVKRVVSGNELDSTGQAINDYKLTVTDIELPDIPVDTGDIDLESSLTVRKLDVTNPLNPTCSDQVISAGATLQTKLEDVLAVINPNNDAIKTLIDLLRLEAVAIGDSVTTVIAPASWEDQWKEPNGQSLLVSEYPDLHALIGYTYGGSGANFSLPDIVGTTPFLRVTASTNPVLAAAGANTVALAVDNIPEHSHTLSSGSMSSSGTHTHSVGIQNGTGGGIADIGGGSGGTSSFLSGADGNHTHTLSGSTGLYGKNPPDAFSVVPVHKTIYLKMRVK